LYRGVEKDVLIANKGIAPIAMFDNYEVKVMGCGHKATIVQIGADKKLKEQVINECIPGVIKKRGYLHLFNDKESA